MRDSDFALDHLDFPDDEEMKKMCTHYRTDRLVVLAESVGKLLYRNQYHGDPINREAVESIYEELRYIVKYLT